MGFFDNDDEDVFGDKKKKTGLEGIFGKRAEKKKPEKRPNRLLHPIKALKYDIKKDLKRKFGFFWDDVD